MVIEVTTTSMLRCLLADMQPEPFCQLQRSSLGMLRKEVVLGTSKQMSTRSRLICYTITAWAAGSYPCKPCLMGTALSSDAMIYVLTSCVCNSWNARWQGCLYKQIANLPKNRTICCLQSNQEPLNWFLVGRLFHLCFQALCSNLCKHFVPSQILSIEPDLLQDYNSTAALLSELAIVIWHSQSEVPGSCVLLNNIVS